MRTDLKYIVGTLGLVLLFGGCDTKGKSKEQPNPEHKGAELRVQSIERGDLIVENKLVKEWQGEQLLDLWAVGGDKVQPFQMQYSAGKWNYKDKSDKPKLATANQLLALYADNSAGTFKVATDGYTFSPNCIANKEEGSYTLSHSYKDILFGETPIEKGNAQLQLKSPYKQLELVILNSAWEQKVTDITIQINGHLADAKYSNGKWQGTPQALSIMYKDKGTAWAGREADTLLMAFPAQSEQVTATIKYTNSNGEQKETITTEESKMVFTFVEEVIDNPPLEFTPLADTNYWKQCNDYAYNLITTNYGGAHTPEEARFPYGWVLVRPLVDEAMHSKKLYKDDFNLIAWNRWQERNWKSNKEEFGFAHGLETLNGELVEVYPPVFSDHTGGRTAGSAILMGTYSQYCYTTVPAGKYRLVLFVSYPKSWTGEETRKWYKLPMLDCLTPFETSNGALEEYKSRELENVPMERSSYKEMDLIEVVDRTATNNVAPRWTMGFYYADWDGYNQHQPRNTKGNDIWEQEYKVGGVFGITAINTSNQNIRGTIVAKAEWLPMHHPDGYWRLQQTAKMTSVEQHRKGGWKYYITAWSHEVGRTEVTLLPNSEQKIGVEINQIDWDWFEDGGHTAQELGPEAFIHFYWVDQAGNEQMMMRVDYAQLQRLKDKGQGKTVSSKDINNSLSQRGIVAPEQVAPDGANGFFWR